MKRSHELLAVSAVLILSGGLCLTSLWNEGPTYDEPVYLLAGQAYLGTGSFDFNAEHPPLWKDMAAVALRLRGVLPEGFNPWSPVSPFRAEEIFRTARLPGAFLFLITALVVFAWSKELWGTAGGLVSLFFYAFSPNLLAHCRLVAPDFPMASFYLMAVYAFWRWSVRPSERRLVVAAAALGAALASRFTAVLLPVCFVLIALGNSALRFGKDLSSEEESLALYRNGWELLSRLGALFLLSLLFLAIPYGFVGIGSYFRGLSKFTGHALDSGHSAFLCGSLSTQGWWHYFFVAIALKTPIPSLLALAAVLARMKRERADRGTELCLWVPVAILLAAASINKVDLGIRLVLPIYPLLFVSFGRLAQMKYMREWRWKKLIAGAMLIWYLAGCFLIHPQYIAYFNELTGSRKGYNYLVDSNIDWGQDLPRLGAYMQENNVDAVLLAYFGLAPPQYYGVKYQYLPSGAGEKERLLKMASGGLMVRGRPRLLAISVTILKGVPFMDASVYGWLEKRAPKARIGYSMLVYDIAGDADASEKIAAIYERFGHPDLAAKEREAWRQNHGK